MARITAVKGPERVIEIARAMPEVRFLMVGGGDLADEIQRLAPENLSLLGWQTPERVWPVADIALSTSHHEGIPISIIEAQMAGVPVVAVNVGAISQVVAYKYNGTAWSATGNMVTQKDRHVVFGASSSLVVASGGNIGGPQPTERFTGTSWAQVGTAIGVRYQRPTSSSQAATTGIAVSGNTATGGVFQWGAEKYYN
jgi:hypothetical protein